jgi:uncharacterized protein
MEMDNLEITQKTEQFIIAEFGSEGSGHDWYHIDRVRKMALRIGTIEGCDLFVTEMAALLHDLDDWKLNGSRPDELGKTKNWLVRLNVKIDDAAKILKVIQEVSYKGAGLETPVSSAEAAVVQDADRLDAMGAIGIARAFAYGGNKNRLIYNPEVLPVMHQNFEAYKNSNSSTINHFYEKLLLLKDRMNTNTARLIAEERHRFMENFLNQFSEEWMVTR